MRTEDGYIIQQCLDGNSAAFGLLVEKYKKGIYALAYSMLRNFHDAQDITQEVFIKAYEKLRTLKRWDNFVGWLYRITSNECKMLIRARARRPDQEFVEDQDQEILNHPAIYSHRESAMYEQVREAVDSLPDMYREVLALRYFSGMTVKEMSRFLGVSPGTIDRRLSGARAMLKEEILVMMSATYEQHSLPANFTFRIVEMVKRIRIHTMPRATALPWGLSLAAGIMLVAMTIGSQLVIRQLSESPVFPGEITPRVREMTVDILSAPGTSIIAGNQGDTDGGGIDPRNPQNNFLLAPAKGGGTWTQKADMPTARCIAGSAVVDGKIYVIGGSPGSCGILSAVEEYDPATDTWTRRADMPTARQTVAAAAVDGIIYAIGGWAGDPVTCWAEDLLLTVEAYDPATDIWTTKADMLDTPTVGTTRTIAVVDGIIYVIGGYDNDDIPVSSVQAYDPATDTWTTKADMPTARNQCAACVIDGRIYVSGGAAECGFLPPTIPTVVVYDPATDIWTQASDMPWGRFGHTASAVDGKMYIAGGVSSEMIKQFGAGDIRYNELVPDEVYELHSIVHVYDPATDTWTTAAADFKGGTYKHTAAVVDGKIYAIGGACGPEDVVLSTVYEYTPGLPDSISATSPAGKLLTTWGQVRAAK